MKRIRFPRERHSNTRHRMERNLFYYVVLYVRLLSRLLIVSTVTDIIFLRVSWHLGLQIIQHTAQGYLFLKISNILGIEVDRKKNSYVILYISIYYPKLQYFLGSKSISKRNPGKINDKFTNNFYPVTSYRRVKEKEGNDELLYTVSVTRYGRRSPVASARAMIIF